ncbi:aminoglycoside phosphotransferase [Georgenia yuyongxinii]|uniref:Aminoglycoside phosphotransferase n=1 Tax=Georgenia yuyongxinii TaxID=2589797 RepID=A0A5B8BZN5_9MICO|nr:aminoglycoside phosphotransferase [Georgenia yuyongxinii]
MVVRSPYRAVGPGGATGVRRTRPRPSRSPVQRSTDGEIVNQLVRTQPRTARAHRSHPDRSTGSELARPPGTDALDLDDVVALTARHGLEVDPDSLQVNEAGLDFRVIYARADGEDWVLRLPRRPDVVPRIGPEAAVLELVRDRIGAAVPDWRIQQPSLIAYPLLPGQPGMTIGPDGDLHWHLDLQSPRYAASFGMLLAELHRIDVAEAQAAGLMVQGPDEVRAQWRADIATVADNFTVAPALLDRWQAWLDDDAFWPDFSVLTHGELYPAHVLLGEDENITAVLDWTTAKVTDPGRDFALHHAVSAPETFARTVAAYEQAGGRTWPRLSDHSAELMAASPVGYALFALHTGVREHLALASIQLDPPL